MKAFFVKFLQVLMLITVFGFSIKTYSQADSARVTYSSESSDSSDYNYHRKYQYLDINLKDETKMFKVAVPTFAITYYNNYHGNSFSQNNLGIIFAFEKKINVSWSAYVENENNYVRYASVTQTNYDFYSIINWGIRHYLFLKNRIKDGISGDNCSGVYVDFRVINLHHIEYRKEKFSNVMLQDTIMNITCHYTDKKLIEAPDLILNLGIQKRLNNYSYFDTRFYVVFSPDRKYFTFNWDNNGNTSINHGWDKSHFVIGVDFKIGLAWGWR